jgi:hypothetical protein
MSAVGAIPIISVAPMALKLLYPYHITALTDCPIRCRTCGTREVEKFFLCVSASLRSKYKLCSEKILMSELTF